MKKLMMVTAMMATATALAAGGMKHGAVQAGAGNLEGPSTEGKDAKIVIDVYPKLSKQALLSAPSIGEASTIGRCWTGRPRQWIVLETKYTTFAKCLEQLTFTWHVVLDTKTATNKDRDDQSRLAPYSYFTTTTTYANIPRGSHAASVCLHPSYLERFGEPVAVGIVISNQNGDILGGDTVAIGKDVATFKGKKFWEDEKVMNAIYRDDIPMIERRQGLQDRSKTIWALINPNDYELVVQQ